jgi:hypothetical protein
MRLLSLLVPLGLVLPSALAQLGGSFEIVGDTLASAMMVWLLLKFHIPYC